MTNHNILPCPFCGGKAHLSTVGRSWYRVTADHAEGCILEEHESDCPQTDDQLPLLLRDWNTRSGYTAVDMATAAADGFRDGAASKSEPCDGCFMAEAEALRKDAARYQHIKSTWNDDALLERLKENTLPEGWDAAIDADMEKEG